MNVGEMTGGVGGKGEGGVWVVSVCKRMGRGGVCVCVCMCGSNTHPYIIC